MAIHCSGEQKNLMRRKSHAKAQRRKEFNLFFAPLRLCVRPSLSPTSRDSRALVLHISAKAGRKHIAALRRQLPRAHEILRSPLREISLALVGDARMSALHEQFMGIAGPTDVLTFPLDLDSRSRVIGGEVIICVPQAVRQARRRGIAVGHELLLYALHGLLHLSGFDDKTDPAFRKMHAMEDVILTRMGLGAVFAAEPKLRGARVSRRAGSTANRRKLGA
jgi:probable rRNA maturation factor